MSIKRALITGITGQDGAYLSKLLLEKGYSVTEIVRRSSHAGVDDHRLRWIGISGSVELRDGDLSDISSIIRIVRDVQPDEFYNLGAQSFVQSSWQQPILTANVTAVAVTNVLEALRITKPDTRFYQASSSEMFGKARQPKQTERRRSIRVHPTLSPNSMVTGSRLIIARASLSTPPPASCSTMKAHCEARNSLPARSRMALRKSNSGWPRNYDSVISTPSATGATPRTMYAQCGRCCSRRSPTIMWSPRVTVRLSATCAASHLNMSVCPWRIIWS